MSALLQEERSEAAQASLVCGIQRASHTVQDDVPVDEVGRFAEEGAHAIPEDSWTRSTRPFDWW